MIKINWSVEEAVALFYFYFNGLTSKNDLKKLSAAYKKRAVMLGIQTDDKFRNINGLSMQLGCITYIVTDVSTAFLQQVSSFMKHIIYTRHRRKYLAVFLKNLTINICKYQPT